jgi:glycine/D-amino acid oxidase-like deaminating enzyme
MSVNRRAFLKTVAAAHAGAALGRPAAAAQTRAPADVIVVGAGAFGGWTAYYLRQLGARVRLVDAYGPGNSRATSGDETRGVRSSYGDRGVHAELWTTWANRAIDRWAAFDADWGRQMKVRLFFSTGDFIFRAAPEAFTERTQEMWKQFRIPFEVANVEDIARDYPQFDLAKIGFALYDPRAGVVRARRACEVVAEAFRQSGGEVLMGLRRAWRSRRRTSAEHPHDRSRGDADGRHVRLCAGSVVSKGVSRSHGDAHQDAARPRPLLRHAAWRRSLYVSESPELEFSRRHGLGGASSGQSRISCPPSRVGVDGSRYQRSRVRSQL